MKRFSLFALILVLSAGTSGCWTGRSRAESFSEEIEVGMSAEEVLSRLGPPDSRVPRGPLGVALGKNEGFECWTYVTRTSSCWKAGWYISFFSCVLTIPALFCFSGIWTDQWYFEIVFDKDHRVIRKAVWTPPQF